MKKINGGTHKFSKLALATMMATSMTVLPVHADDININDSLKAYISSQRAFIKDIWVPETVKQGLYRDLDALAKSRQWNFGGYNESTLAERLQKYQDDFREFKEEKLQGEWTPQKERAWAAAEKAAPSGPIFQWAEKKRQLDMQLESEKIAKKVALEAERAETQARQAAIVQKRLEAEREAEREAQELNADHQRRIQTVADASDARIAALQKPNSTDVPATAPAVQDQPQAPAPATAPSTAPAAAVADTAPAELTPAQKREAADRKFRADAEAVVQNQPNFFGANSSSGNLDNAIENVRDAVKIGRPDAFVGAPKTVNAKAPDTATPKAGTTATGAIRTKAADRPKTETAKQAPAQQRDNSPAAFSMATCREKKKEIQSRGTSHTIGGVTGYFTPKMSSLDSGALSMEGALQTDSSIYASDGTRFSKSSVPSGCIFGFGNFGYQSKTTANGKLSPCLDPLFTVAIHGDSGIRSGDVLYIPALEKKVIGKDANGKPIYHPGCVIAKDSGGAITGKRMDFFTGLCRNYNTNNNTCMDRGNDSLYSGLSGAQYFVAPKDIASKVLAERQQQFQVAYQQGGSQTQVASARGQGQQ